MNVLLSLLPLLFLAVGALLVMLVEAFGKNDGGEEGALGRLGELSIITAVVFFAAAIGAVAVALAAPSAQVLAPHLIVDRFGLFLAATVAVGGGLCALIAGAYLREHRIDRSEFFPLLLLASTGAMGLILAGHLMVVFVSLETLSLGTYCLVAARRTPRSFEAALKYFLLGGFASALFLFGAALLYGATGQLALAEIGERLADAPHFSLPGMVLMVVGLGFKVAAVPFHTWTPDAYEGAPTPTTAFMAGVVKVAAFGMVMRILHSALIGEGATGWAGGWPPVIATLAVLTMTVANVIAVRQSSVKRMLAYSSISHAGYLLLGVLAGLGSQLAVPAVALYLLVYSLSTIGAFGALAWTGCYGREATSYNDLAGLGRRHPAVALLLSIFVLSLAGIPPLAGFFGKLMIFSAAMQANLTLLVVIALINSVVAAYYYLRVLVVMYMKEPEPDAAVAIPMRAPVLVVAMTLAAIAVLALGVAPEWIGRLALLTTH